MSDNDVYVSVLFGVAGGAIGYGIKGTIMAASLGVGIGLLTPLIILIVIGVFASR